MSEVNYSVIPAAAVIPSQEDLSAIIEDLADARRTCAYLSSLIVRMKVRLMVTDEESGIDLATAEESP